MNLPASSYPTELKTREDYDFARQNFDFSLWKKDWRALLFCKTWRTTKTSDSLDGLIQDSTHRVIKNQSPAGVSYVEQEYVDDPSAKINLFGLTQEEVKQILIAAGDSADELNELMKKEGYANAVTSEIVKNDTSEEVTAKQAELDAKYAASKAELYNQYVDAAIHADTETQESIKNLMAQIDAQYDADYAATKEK
ncbi:hypothetical protein LIQ52_05370 [Mitsuokella jalaludinii]|uniref:hypothetical protein n=1 Tax=Mitsuokella jalaludinii TaxID=187979 RepID=UPI001D0353C6|nr:hypothetical protein [Mitsuokella jalaludinii]MCB5724758.1 hypothetical protein [Mitsuokella jalaludinii]